MRERLPDETFEAKIEYTSEKSYLVELTLGGRYFVPKSQIVHLSEPDIDGNMEFTVTGWWWSVRREAD
jgi:hypothetical protein